MLDRDFANRFLCFYLFGYENYTPDLDTFMSKAMASIHEKSEYELDKIKSDFSEAMKLSFIIFGNEAFRKIVGDYNRLPPINKALFDAISTQFAILNEKQRIVLASKKMVFKRELKELLISDPVFFTSISSSTGDKNRVKKRHETIEKLISKTINE
jgi:hypothetical protein